MRRGCELHATRLFHIWDIIPDVKQEVTGPELPAPDPVDARLGARLAELRAAHGWSLGELAERSGVSRSTLSRAERAEISPTASLLNRLCHVYGRTMSQLLSEVEAEHTPLVRAAEQAVWHDRASGFVRRSVSPPHAGLRGELVEGRLAAGADISYDRPLTGNRMTKPSQRG